VLATLALALVLNQPASAAPAAWEQVVCRSLSETGTRLLTRVCLTPDAWAAIKAERDERRARQRPVIDNRRPGRIGRG
jgi:hypothetical protein